MTLRPFSDASKERGESYVDALMWGLQCTHAEINSVRFGPLSLRLGVAGVRELADQNEIQRKGSQVAKIIEFYIPNNFRNKGKWIPPQNRGKIIQFAVPPMKTA